MQVQATNPASFQIAEQISVPVQYWANISSPGKGSGSPFQRRLKHIFLVVKYSSKIYSDLNRLAKHKNNNPQYTHISPSFSLEGGRN